MARTKNNIVKDAVISITNLDITDLLNRGLNKNIFSHNNNGPQIRNRPHKMTQRSKR